jgi:hypothetical protein
LAAEKKLSYLEAREYAGIEQCIAVAEQVLQSKREKLENPAIASEGTRLVAAHAEMEAAQRDLDALYARWAELEEGRRFAAIAHSITLFGRGEFRCNAYRLATTQSQSRSFHRKRIAKFAMPFFLLAASELLFLRLERAVIRYRLTLTLKT